MSTAKYSLVFNGDGFLFNWTVVEGPKATGPVVMTSRDYPSYEAMRAACLDVLKAMKLDVDGELVKTYDCEPKEKAVRSTGTVVAVSKLPDGKSTWHIVSSADWVLQMKCDVCPCKKGDAIRIEGKLVRVGALKFRLLKTYRPVQVGGFTVHTITEVK